MPITLLSIILFGSLATLSFFRTYIMQENVTFWICWIESLILISFFFPVNDSRNSSSFLSYSGAKWIAHYTIAYSRSIYTSILSEAVLGLIHFSSTLIFFLVLRLTRYLQKGNQNLHRYRFGDTNSSAVRYFVRAAQVVADGCKLFGDRFDCLVLFTKWICYMAVLFLVTIVVNLTIHTLKIFAVWNNANMKIIRYT